MPSRADRLPDGASSAEVVEAIATLRRAHGLGSVSVAAPAPPRPPAPATAASVDAATREITRLRSLRGSRERELAISTLVQRTRDDAKSRRRRMGQLIELWLALVPPALIPCAALAGLRGGVLHVVADSAPVAFELDRLLREGLLARLRRGYAGSLTRVRVTVGAS